MYKIQREKTRPTSAHNAKSWNKIKDLQEPYTIQEFANRVGNHTPPKSWSTQTQDGNNIMFIVYCIQSGWIKPVL